MSGTQDSRAPFERVSDDLRRQIESGELPVGQRLPSGRELAERYTIALATAQSALRRLRDEGLATSTPRGYYVAVPSENPTDDVRAVLEELRGALADLTARVEHLERLLDR